MTYRSMERRALTSILSVSSLLRRGLMARASSGGKFCGGAAVGASRGMMLVPLDFRETSWGRARCEGLGVSSVSVEVPELDWDEGGVGRDVETGSDFTMEGTAGDAWKGSSKPEGVEDMFMDYEARVSLISERL